MKSPILRRPAAFRSALQVVASLCWFGLLSNAHPALSAERTPPIKVTHFPASAGASQVLKLEAAGRVGIRYTAFDVADNTTFDLTGIHFSPGFEHPTQTTFTAGNQDVPPKGIHVIGGVVDSCIPHEWSWRLSHGFGGSAFYTVSTGLQVIEGARIHNVEDGWSPRETPGFRLRSYPNTGRFLMRGCYMTGVRDDCIENDEFLPGEVEDCLFDGVWTFFSEQNERPNGVLNPGAPTIGPDEDPSIRITRVLARLYTTSPDENCHGMWFKLMGKGAPVHKFIITDTVFAADKTARSGWGPLNFDTKGTAFEFRGTNYILWLGEPGKYGAKVPPGVVFMEGQAAREKWHRDRNEWLVAHGYEPRSADDWNPMEAPVAPPRRK